MKEIERVKKLIADYKPPGILVIPKDIGWSMEEFAEAARIVARCGATTEEMVAALTPEKKPESIRGLLDAPMRKWREE